MCIGKKSEFYILYIFGGEKLKMFTCTSHSGNLITYNLKDDYDIQLKRGHFYWPVNSFCTKFERTSSNLDVDPNFMHIFVPFMIASSDNFLANYLMIYELRCRKLWEGNLLYRTHRYPHVLGCQHTRDDLINRFKHFFDSPILSSNAIVQFGLAFNAVFNSTPIGLCGKHVRSGNDEN